MANPQHENWSTQTIPSGIPSLTASVNHPSPAITPGASNSRHSHLNGHNTESQDDHLQNLLLGHGRFTEPPNHQTPRYPSHVSESPSHHEDQDQDANEEPQTPQIGPSSISEPDPNSQPLVSPMGEGIPPFPSRQTVDSIQRFEEGEHPWSAPGSEPTDAGSRKRKLSHALQSLDTVQENRPNSLGTDANERENNEDLFDSEVEEPKRKKRKVGTRSMSHEPKKHSNDNNDDEDQQGGGMKME